MEPIPAAEAVEALIQDYGRLIFHLVYSMTGNWEESQDLTQETFLHALQAIDTARAATGARFHARAWLVRIAINAVRMRQRRLRVVRFLPFSRFEGAQAGEQDASEVSTVLSVQASPAQPAGYGASGVEDPAEVIAERDAVARTLAKLPESLRLPLLLSTVAGFSISEMARVLDLSEVAVRQRLSRAKRTFQALYAYESGEQVVNQEAREWRSPRLAGASGGMGFHPLQDAPARPGS